MARETEALSRYVRPWKPGTAGGCDADHGRRCEVSRRYPGAMCRNITILRGLEPPVTGQEIEDAARQFVRKVAGLTSPTQMERPDVARAVSVITVATRELLDTLPARRSAPPGPPGRRRLNAVSPLPRDLHR